MSCGRPSMSSTCRRTIVSWGGRQLGVDTIDGVERPVFEMPYVTYSDGVERVVRLLVDLGVVVPFEWPAWPGRNSYHEGDGLDHAPVAEATRLLSTIVGAERFSDGTLAEALEDGSFVAALGRLRRWQHGARQPG